VEGENMARNVGTKYEPGRDLKETAKLVRKELKATFGPAWKFGVRLSRYSMGQSLDVSIKEAPCRLVDLEGYTQAGLLAVDTVQKILDDYNRQDIDSQTDYYNVAFWGNVQVDFQLRKRQREALRQAA
jgi:hypothetical protein